MLCVCKPFKIEQIRLVNKVNFQPSINRTNFVAYQMGFTAFPVMSLWRDGLRKDAIFIGSYQDYHILHRLLNIKIIDFCIIEYSRPPRLKGKDCTKRASYLSRNILYIKSITISQTSKPAFLRIRNFFIFIPRDKRLIHQYYIIMINKNENCCPICWIG